MGQHTGASYYTIGQRKGLGLGGQGEAWFVVGKDMSRNVVIVERGETHPHLFSDTLSASDCSFIQGSFSRELPFSCTAKIRYRQKDQKCTITKIEGDKIFVEFSVPQRAITPRQSIVFYEEDHCLGGAMIIGPGPSYFEMNKDLTSTLDH